MPEISRFFGIVIKMFSDEHNPPHLHAEHAEYRATFNLNTGLMIDGAFPKNKTALVTAWIIIHKQELLENWLLLADGNKANKIKELE